MNPSRMKENKNVLIAIKGNIGFLGSDKSTFHSNETQVLDKSGVQLIFGIIFFSRQYGAFTLDVVATCAFGTKINSLGSPDDRFVEYARKAFNSSQTRSVATVLICMFI